VLTILLAVLAAASNAVSSVLQRVANRDEADSMRSGLASLAHLLRRPVWLFGLAAVIASFLLQAAALSSGEVSEVQPLMALELPMTLVLASRVFRHGLRRQDWTAIAAMATGMALFLFALHPTGGDSGDVSALAWSVGGGVTGAVVTGLVALAWQTRGMRRAALLGVASGVSFALTAVFVSATLAQGLTWAIFSRWQTYLLVVAGLCAMVLLQWGMQAGTLVAVQPGVTLADPVAAVVLGVLVFSERIRLGPWLVAEVAAAAAVGWGAFVLSGSPVVASDDDDAGDARPAVRAEPSAGT
jgi:drug/metabolite transporter (DMT)-like permease